jgi:hypothetical protein
VLGSVGAGGEVHAYAIAQGDLDQVEQPTGSSDTTVAVELRGDILGPYFNRWLLFYDSVQRHVPPQLLGSVRGRAGRWSRSDHAIAAGARGGSVQPPILSQAPIRDAKVDWAARVDSISRCSKG